MIKLNLTGIPVPFCYFKTISRRLISGFLLFLCFSCKKEAPTPETLPPLTRNGANTFGAVVNGKVITAKGASSFKGGMYADAAADSCLCWLPPDSSDLFLRIFHKDMLPTTIVFNDPRHIPEWKLNRSTNGFWEFGKIQTYIQIGDNRTSISTDGWIKSDFHKREDGIFSAEFSYQCIHPKTCQVYTVENGRIDVNLNAIAFYP